VFGKLMDNSGSVSAVADYMTKRLGKDRAMLAVVLAGAIVTYGDVSLFVAFFVLAPMAQALFRTASIPSRLMPAAIILGTSTFTMSALPGTPSIQNAIPMPFRHNAVHCAWPRHHRFADHARLRPWWLHRAERKARRTGEGYGGETPVRADAAVDGIGAERATSAREFDPTEMHRGEHSDTPPSIAIAALWSWSPRSTC
jgi:hypothetical protein